MMLDRVEVRSRFLNRVAYLLFARVQIVEGISSRLGEDYFKHRILWDLDDCTLSEALHALRKVQLSYNLGDIHILSDKDNSYGAVCNTIVDFKEYLKILIDTDLIDPLFTRYALQRHEGILRLSDKENRPIKRDEVLNIPNKTLRESDENGYYIVKYETGYIKKGIRTGDFFNDQKRL